MNHIKNNMNKAFERDHIGKHPIVLWGGQMYGEIAYYVITNLYHGKVEAIVDHKLAKVPWADLKTISASELSEYDEVDVIICAANAYQEIYDKVLTLGTNMHIYDCRSILKDYRDAYMFGHTFTNYYLYGDIDLNEIIDKYDYYAGADNGYHERLYLSYCVLCITSKCSLKCKNCAAFITKYQRKSDYTLEYIKNNFALIVDAVDGIGELELMGGEPFLCSEFDEILSWCIDQDKIHAIKIVTNGTIMPKDTTWDILRHNKVKLVIDDYGKLSKNMDALIGRAKITGVRFEQQKLRTWYKIEPVIKKDFSEERLIEIFSKCSFRTCVGLTNGRFYHCNVCGHMNTVGLLADEECEYLQIEGKKWNITLLRNELKKFLAKEYLKSCDYCNLYMNEEVEVAEQE